MSDRKPTPDVMGALLGPIAQTVMVSLHKISLNGGTQMRAELDKQTITEYTEKFAEQGAWGSFPPVVLFHDGSTYWIADGFHRIQAYRSSGILQKDDADPDRNIPADVRSGTRRDAVLFAASANAAHGLRRTNADKRRSVEVLLRDEEWGKWSDSEIARKCMVSQNFVSTMRRELTQIGFESPTERTGADGRTINTANIGTARTPAPTTAPAASPNKNDYQYTAPAPPVETKPLIVPGAGQMQAMIERLHRDEDLNLWPNDEKWLIGRIATMAFRNGWQVTDAFVQEQLDITRRDIDEENKRNARLEHARQVAAEAEREFLAQEAADKAARQADVDAILNPVPVSQRADYDSDEWYTPKEYIDAARQVMGAIDLDPATCEMAQTVVQAENYLTKIENGLAMTWICERVWLNPPYSNPEAWISKLVTQYEGKQHVKQACVLVNNATETAWFQILLTRYPVCFPNKRMAFWRHDHEGVTARQGQAIFYLGGNVAQFAKTFGEFGPVLRRMA